MRECNVGQRHGRFARPRTRKNAECHGRGARRGHSALCSGGPPECGQIEHHQRFYRRGAQHCDRYRRHHARLGLHALRQVRIRLLSGRYGWYPPQEQGFRESGILQRDALHPCHREQRCLHPDDRRHARHRGAGHEHFPDYPEEPEVACGGGEQVGPRGRQVAHRCQNVRECHPRANGSVRGFPDCFRLGTDETAHFQGARTGEAGLSEPHIENRHHEAQRGDAAAHRSLSAALNQGKIH